MKPEALQQDIQGGGQRIKGLAMRVVELLDIEGRDGCGHERVGGDRPELPCGPPRQFRFVRSVSALVAATLLGRSLRTTTTMAKYWECLQPNLIAWIVAQKLFWVATSPLSPDGHVNVSPKGVAGTFHVIDERRVWYEDLTGSGTNIRLIFHFRSSLRYDLRNRDNLSYTR